MKVKIFIFSDYQVTIFLCILSQFKLENAVLISVPDVHCDFSPSLPGDAGSGPSSRNASVERGGGERQSDTSDSETTDVRRINQQPSSREGRYDPNR